jgi:hypothetical protein
MDTITSQSPRLAWLGLLLCAGWLGCADQEEPVAGEPAGASAGGAAPSVASPTSTSPQMTNEATSSPTKSSTPAAGTAKPTTGTTGTTGTTPTTSGAMPAPANAPQPTAGGPVTYHKDIRPLMQANCSMACHGPDPATRAGPVALDTYESTRAVGELVVAAVVSLRMPPWPADDNCRQLRDTPSITPEQRELFTKWQEADFPEGNAEDFVPPPPSIDDALGEPTRYVEMARAHTPPGEADQYYCGIGDYTFPEDTYIRAIEVIPDQKTLVHHVQVHVVSSGICTVGDNIYSWRPGGKRLTFSEGDATLLSRGSQFALQMHYNTFGKTPAPDKTRVAVWELPAGTKPERTITRTGVFGLVPVLPPGAVETTGSSANVGGNGVEIIGVSPHAHMIAKRLTAKLDRGGEELCLTDVPDWNFEWQLDYIFKEPLPLQVGDVVRVTCDYDNTPSNQPTVDGVKRQTPITVVPGEGSTDEMCLHYIWLRRPTR